MTEKWIWLDCDGTWIDLYGVDGWLEMLQNFDSTPYEIAKPLVNLSVLARTIHDLQKANFKVGIISWLSKHSTPEYDKQVTTVKIKYIEKHLPSVQFDKICIIPYGTPKSTCGSGILFDDEEKNRIEWGLNSYDEKNLIKNLRQFLKAAG